MRAAGLALSVALVALGTSCALERGEAFGTLEPTLEVQLTAPADRALEDGFQQLASDFQVRVTKMELEVDAVLLDRSEGVGSAASFDPASPPPGYSLCHNGHCHTDDGRLVPYEEIAADLSAGDGSAGLAAVLEVGTVSLLDGRRVRLRCGDCALEEGHIGRIRLSASRLVLELEARDGRAEPRLAGTVPAPATIDLGALASGDDRAPGEVETAVDIPIDEDSPPVVELAMSIEATVAILDGVDFAALPLEGDALDLGRWA